MNQNERDTIIRGAVMQVFARASKDAIKSVVASVCAAYGEEHRHHHDLFHPAEMLLEAQNYQVADLVAFKGAIVFHDYKMDLARSLPGYDGPTNEKESADICKAFMSRHGVARSSIERAHELIMVTEKHKAPTNDPDALRMIDLDLFVLGSSRDRYRRYALGIAREYLSVHAPEDYMAGRTKFLSAWIERDTIFSTHPFTLRNQQARENMAWERDNLPALVTQARARPFQNTPQMAYK